MNKVYISAAHKSSGKTTVSLGLCAAFHRKNISIQPFKKGPDYIEDPDTSVAGVDENGTRDKQFESSVGVFSLFEKKCETTGCSPT